MKQRSQVKVIHKPIFFVMVIFCRLKVRISKPSKGSVEGGFKHVFEKLGLITNG